jgi:transcriptional regulator GlxA family with amidase domain
MNHKEQSQVIITSVKYILSEDNNMAKKKICAGIFIFDDVQTIDFAGPLEVFDQAGFNVFTIGKTAETISTSSGQPLIPRFNFSNHPPIDILVIPAGRDLDLAPDQVETQWMKKTSESCKYILTICCGSIELAKAGLLGNRSATTHHAYLDQLKKYGPDSKIVVDRKWVEDGNIISSGGMCSGIDASLYVVSKLNGIEEAERIAKWMEFSWNKDGTRDY